MTEDYPVQGLNIEAARQRAVDVLMEHFSNDVMGLDEFEGLLDVVNRCATVAELRGLLADLPALESSKLATDMIPAGGGVPIVVDADRVRERGYLISVLGGTNRAGRWIPARKNFAIGVLGGLSLDFRESLLGPGVTDLNVLAVMGGVEIIVPPEMAVEVDGIALLGGFDHRTTAPLRNNPNLPTLRVRGLALMGGVEIKVRLPGETSREARSRRRLERKTRRRR